MAEPMRFEELRVLQEAEAIADAAWSQVAQWPPFARDTVGSQLARAADSIGANIAEAFGRFHYGEKLQFLYYARGSLFETKYWLNRALARELMSPVQTRDYVTQLTDLARQLNNFSATLKTVRRGPVKPTTVSESTLEYSVETATDPALPASIRAAMVPEGIVEWSYDAQAPLFVEDDLTWLQTIPNT